jgi:hypothetical protein
MPTFGTLPAARLGAELLERFTRIARRAERTRVDD